MSYAIVKSITIKDGKVIVCAASNNVCPKDFSPNEAVSLSDILNDKGRSALDEVIFGEFRKGHFQGLSTQYAKALVWQKQHNITCKDSELLSRFSKAWNEAGIVVAKYMGYPVNKVGKNRFEYSLSPTAAGKQFKNKVQGMYYMRRFNDITFETV